MTKKYFLAILTIALCFNVVSAQSEYNVVNGPNSFMQLNDAGDDFVSVDMGTTDGYTFYHSYWDYECPWSVVSDGGLDIYTNLNMDKVTDYSALRLITPTLNLESSKSYKFSQALSTVLNVAGVGDALIYFDLSIVSGNANDFDIDFADNSIQLVEFFEASPEMEYRLSATDIIVPTDGAYYFVVSISYYNTYGDALTGMSVKFGQNVITDNDYVSSIDAPVNSVSVFPNPSTGTLNLLNARGSVQIFDITGKIVSNYSNYTGEALDVSSLSKGIYLVGVNGEFHRFIKE